jgi:hypothetical protein
MKLGLKKELKLTLLHCIMSVSMACPENNCCVVWCGAVWFCVILCCIVFINSSSSTLLVMSLQQMRCRQHQCEVRIDKTSRDEIR